MGKVWTYHPLYLYRDKIKTMAKHKSADYKRSKMI